MGKHARSVGSEIVRRIGEGPAGALFTAADFLDLGSRAAVDQALLRNARAGLLRKLARGQYGLASDAKKKRLPVRGSTGARKAPSLDAESTAWIRKAARRHGMGNPRVFGSVASGRSRPDSDLDLLVRLGPGRGYADLLAFCDELEARLQRKVDVLTDDALHPDLHRAILAEAIPL